VGRQNKISWLFFNENCHVDYTAGIQKYYGNFNNILSILGRNRNEMAAVHLTVSYCVLSLLYGCELWTLTSSAYHKMNVIWNNAFRTRSSAIAEGPRDASCQWKSCQLPRNSAETTYTTSPEQIDGMKLEI